jgi:genome maintenance exonuclease 1
MNTQTLKNKFLHNFLYTEECERVDVNGSRYYQTPYGAFKSVTTFLGEKLDKSGLDNWRKAVGEEVANRISYQASTRGTAIHSLAERYLMNESISYFKEMPSDISTFLQIKPILDQNIGSIYGCEKALYSKQLQLAGTCDLLAGFNGVNSIIDFKTSRKEKKEEHIISYFLQTTIYSMCAEEMFDLKFPQIVVIITSDEDNKAQVFIKKAEDYKQRVLDLVN